MLSLGCVQSLICNTNHCPTGVATQDPDLASGLVVTDKRERVARFHKDTMEHLVEILGAAGLRSHQMSSRVRTFIVASIRIRLRVTMKSLNMSMLVVY